MPCDNFRKCGNDCSSLIMVVFCLIGWKNDKERKSNFSVLGMKTRPWKLVDFVHTCFFLASYDQLRHLGVGFHMVG